jgi:hypothetical protein
MDADHRGLEESAGHTDGVGDYFHDTGPAGGEDDFEGPSADAAGLPDDEPESEATDGDAAAGPLEMKVERLDAEEPAEAYEIDPSPHSLLSVLFPAKPPRPRNARIIRLFDVEAKDDADPAAEAPPEELPKEEPRSREAVRAARNQSLLVAARLRLD